MNDILIIARREVYEQLWLKKYTFVINIIILLFIISLLSLQTLSFIPNPSISDISNFLSLAVFFFPFVFGTQMINNYSIEPFYLEKTKGNLELLIASQIPLKAIFFGKIIAISTLVLLTLIVSSIGLLLAIYISYGDNIINMIFAQMTFIMYMQLIIIIPFLIFCLTSMIGFLFWKLKDIRLISIAVFAILISCFFLFKKFIEILQSLNIFLIIIAQIIICAFLLIASLLLFKTIKPESLLRKT